MNSSLLTLLKFDIRYYLIPRFATKKEKRKYIGIIALMAFAFIVPIFMLVSSIYASAKTLTDVNNLAEMVSMLFASTEIATIFFTLYPYMQIMYLSKDNEFLLNLPVKTTEVFIGKIVTVLITQIIISSVILIPALISVILGVSNAGLIKISAWFYIIIPIAIVTLPFLPLMLLAILSFPIMKIMTFFKKHPTAGALVSSFLICGIVAAIYIPLYSNIYGSDAVENDSMVMDLSGLFAAGSKIPHTFMLAKAAMNVSAALNLFLYLLIVFGVFVLGIFVSKIFYKNFMYSTNENSGITKGVKKGEEFVSLSLEKSLLKREFAVITRDTNKFMNVLMSVIMGPLMTGILIFVMNMAANSQAPDPETGEVFTFTSIMFCGFASSFTIMMLGGSNIGASAGFSLEGQSLYVLKAMPVKGSNVFKAKLFFNDILSVISIFAVCIVMMLMIDRVNIIDILGLIVSSALTVNALDYFSLKRDLKKPILNWTNIKEITKNNFGTLLPMLISLPAAFIAIIAGIVLDVVLSPMLNEYLISLIFWGIMIIIGLLYFLIIRGFKTRNEDIDLYFERIE